MIRAVVGPLVRGSTYRRGVHQLLGGVLLLPYVLLGVAFVQLFRGGGLPWPAVLVLLAVAGVIAVTPAFLDGTRAVEIVAARTLLDVDLPDPIARADRETRLRSALWFALHLAFGGLTGFGLFAALPIAFVFVGRQFGLDAELGPLADANPALVSLLGVAMLVALGYIVAGLGALAAQVAPALLGPSQADEIAALQQRAERLAERNRLARELHDSVGHALTVTTIQAAAAQRLVDSDPEFVRTALAAIEKTGRSAMEDLDHVLGLLRDDGADRAAPVRTLADVDRIVADARASGLTVDLAIDGPLSTVPAAVSREGYRIVQEGLTNVVRHAGRVPTELRIGLADGTLRIELANPVGPAPPPPSGGVAAEPAPSGGRGLAGMRERVDLLGGAMTAGRDGERWRVAVRLPTGEERP
jgi:signal transduction histidine kinase